LNEILDKNKDILIKQDINEDDILDNFVLLSQYKKAIDESAIVSKTNNKGIITYVNSKFCEVSGYTQEELLGQSHNIIKHPNTPKAVFKELWQSILNKKIYKGILKNKKKNGQSYYVDTTIIPIVDDKNEIVEFIATRYDITKIYEQEKIIKRQYLDALTGLPNRIKFLQDIKELKFANIALVNINRFIDINNFYGFETGDKVLKKFADIITKLNTSNLTLYKLSNDIFAILSKEESTLDDLKYFCKIIAKSIVQKPIFIKNNSFYLNITIGLSCDCTQDSINLLSKAEHAVKLARRQNRPILFLDENIELYEKLQKDKKLVKDIKNALEKNNLLVYGQKIIKHNTDIRRIETLMRIKLDDGTILTPFQFLEQAKKSNLYLGMTRILVKKACEYFQGKNINFSINLTLEDLTDQYTLDFIYNTILRTKTQKFVAFEIVEDEKIENFEEVNSFIKKTQQIGCQFAIDDFGTGYSNFEYVAKLSINCLKIDGSLIKNIHIDKNMYFIVKAIVDLAKSLNKVTVAEFVHCKEVFDIVKELGVDYMQGYYLHKPEELKADTFSN